MTPSKLRVVELREELLARGLSPKGLKKELVDRLDEAIKGESSSQPGVALGETPPGPDDDEHKEKAADDAMQPTALMASSESDKVQSSGPAGKADVDAAKEEVLLDYSHAPVEELATPALAKPDASVQQGPLADSGEKRALDEAETGPEGKEAKVDIPEQAPTCYVHVLNLCRPFAVPALREMLSTYGAVEDFWIDPIKSHCYVKYAGPEQADACRRALYGMRWPLDNSRRLVVDFVPDMTIAEQTVSSVDSSQPSADAAQAKGEARKQSKTLEDLFFKTEAQPALYYLPAVIDETNRKTRPLATPS